MKLLEKYTPRRSLLFIPANRPDRFAKALASGADMVCVELEDGVALDQKDMARTHMIEFFAEQASASPQAELLVRINGLDEPHGQADLEAIFTAAYPPSALMVPKIKTAEEVVQLDQLLSKHAPQIKLHLLIETAEALEQAGAIAAASSRLSMILFGGVDLAAELRSTTSWDALIYARGRVVHAAARAGVEVMDMPYLAVRDKAGLCQEAERARDMGYGGKAAIHPDQVADINQVFTPDAEAIAQAKKIIEAYQQAPTGVVVLDGRLIEKPVIRKMQQILSISQALES